MKLFELKKGEQIVKFWRIFLLLFFITFNSTNSRSEQVDKKKCFSWFFGDGDDTGVGQPCNQKVDTSCSICEQEKEHIDFVSEKTEESFLKLVGVEKIDPEKKLPKIAFCFSGGGYRAMVSSLGFMLGAQDVGLLDAASYISVLSGSSWMLANFLIRKHFQNIDWPKFREIAQKRAAIDFWDIDTFDTENFGNKITNVFSYRKKVEPADLWGAILSDRLFGDIFLAQDITFSHLCELFNKKLFDGPFPLFSLTITDVFPYEWFEVNPFITGSDYLGSYIPTSMFDSSFKSGVCVEKFNEKSIGWFLALFGSAYNVSFADTLILLAKETNNDSLLNIFFDVINQFNIYERRFLTSPVYNFSWNLQGSPLKKERLFEVSDAGMAFNLPFPPLFKEGRQVDIIFVCDASTSVFSKGYPELHYAQAYMKRKGLKFPPLKNPKKISNHFAIFEDENDKTVPMIIYFSNPIKISTGVLTYPKETFDNICDSMKNLLINNKEIIVDSIKRKID